MYSARAKLGTMRARIAQALRPALKPRRHHLLFFAALYLFCGLAHAQTTAHLQTSETELDFEAGPASPRLASLRLSGQPQWRNRRFRSSARIGASRQAIDRYTLEFQSRGQSDQRAARVICL